jgi:hypothetical protein
MLVDMLLLFLFVLPLPEETEEEEGNEYNNFSPISPVFSLFSYPFHYKRMKEEDNDAGDGNDLGNSPTRSSKELLQVDDGG